MNKTIISRMEFEEFIINYNPFNNPVRFGQAFCNEFNITDDKLFFETDDTKAGQLMEKYLE